MNAGGGSQQQEKYRLPKGERGSTQNLPQHQGQPREGSDQDRLQKPFMPVLNDGDRRENGGEKNNQSHRAGKKILQIVHVGRDQRPLGLE